jgi:hypothetical protein
VHGADREKKLPGYRRAISPDDESTTAIGTDYQ